MNFNQINKLETEWIFEYFYKQKTKRSIINTHKIYQAHLNKIIKKFRNKIKIRQNQNRRFLNKHKVLSIDLLNKIELISKHNIGIPLHICDFKEIIIKDHRLIEWISNNIISRGLKSNLKSSYQLYSKLPKKIFIKEIFRKMIESSLLLKRMETSDSEWIYWWIFISTQRFSIFWMSKDKLEASHYLFHRAIEL